MKIEFINLQKQYQSYKDSINREITEVLESSAYIRGDKIKSLESALSAFTGCDHSIACSSGTDALILALMAIGLKPGDEVIVPTFTFIATAEAVAFLGGVPVFVDIEAESYNIDVEKLEEKITRHTKCIIPVALFGQTADMDVINQLAVRYSKKYGSKIYVIEDAAQSFGATYKGRKSCNLSDLACTSFFPAKPLGCYGDGGAVFTNDGELAEQIRIILNHGQTQKYVHSRVGINGRLDTIQAGVLLAKMNHYEDEISKRQVIAKYYSDHLKTVKTPRIEPGYTSVWAQYCVRSENRDKLMEKCKIRGIPTAIYYPIPLHMQEVFKSLGEKAGSFPVAEMMAKEIFALPMSAFLELGEQKYIVEALNEE